jgi:hypothetical protein
MAILEKVLKGFDNDIINYVDLWTKAPDISRTNIKQLKWFYKEQELFRAKPHPKYHSESITYTFNDSGVRLYDNTGGDKLLACFGCSCTLGVGLPDHETWPYILQELMGSEYTALNFGTAGSSIDYSTRMIYTFLQEYTPHAVICFFPDIFRKEYFSFLTKKYTHMSLNMPVERIPSKKEFEAYCNLTNDYDCFLNFVKNFKFIQTLCELKKIPFIWHTWSQFLLNMEIKTLKSFLGPNTHYIEKNGKLFDIPKEYNLYKPEDYARDHGHPGAQHNRVLASEFVKLLNK